MGRRGELGGGQWPLMIICSLLVHPANAFISRLSSRDPMQQQGQIATSCQTHRNTQAEAEYTHTGATCAEHTF